MTSLKNAIVAMCLVVLSTVSNALPGTRDLTFGNNGLASNTPAGLTGSSGRSVAVGSDGISLLSETALRCQSQAPKCACGDFYQVGSPTFHSEHQVMSVVPLREHMFQ